MYSFFIRIDKPVIFKKNIYIGFEGTEEQLYQFVNNKSYILKEIISQKAIKQ